MTHFLWKFSYSRTQQHYNYIRARQYPAAFGLCVTGLYVLQWSLRTSRTVLVRPGTGRGMWLLLATQCTSPKTALKVLPPILCFSAQRRPWLTELSMAEGHQDHWGTGTWDMETLVERWVCPAHGRASCFFSNSLVSVYSNDGARFLLEMHSLQCWGKWAQAADS